MQPRSPLWNLFWKVSTLPSVLSLCEDLKVRFAVQSADERTSQRVDVVDLVGNSGRRGEPIGLSVNLLDSALVGPCRSGQYLHGLSLGTASDNLVLVERHPRGPDLKYPISMLLSVCALLVSLCGVDSEFLVSVSNPVRPVVIQFRRPSLGLARRLNGAPLLWMRDAIGAARCAALLSIIPIVCLLSGSLYLSRRGFALCSSLFSQLFAVRLSIGGLLRLGLFLVGEPVRLTRCLQSVFLRGAVGLALLSKFVLMGSLVGSRPSEFTFSALVFGHRDSFILPPGRAGHA